MCLFICFQFSIIECVLSAIGDEFPILLKERKYNIIFRGVFVTIAFLLGLPMVFSVSNICYYCLSTRSTNGL